jgi:hypothetical protein
MMKNTKEASYNILLTMPSIKLLCFNSVFLFVTNTCFVPISRSSSGGIHASLNFEVSMIYSAGALIPLQVIGMELFVCLDMGSFASGECCAPPQLNHTDDWNGYADDVS